MRFSFFGNSRRPALASTGHVKISAPHGLHADFARRVTEVARRFQSSVMLESGDGRRADARSLLQLLLLGAACGTCVGLRVVGDDAPTALAAVADVLGGEAVAA